MLRTTTIKQSKLSLGARGPRGAREGMEGGPVKREEEKKGGEKRDKKKRKRRRKEKMRKRKRIKYRKRKANKEKKKVFINDMEKKSDTCMYFAKNKSHACNYSILVDILPSSR